VLAKRYLGTCRNGSGTLHCCLMLLFFGNLSVCYCSVFKRGVCLERTPSRAILFAGYLHELHTAMVAPDSGWNVDTRYVIAVPPPSLP
jgi:hypothetical protein